VTCQLQYLRHCLRQRIRRALDELPDTLDETYDRTLEEIGKQNWEYAHRLFQCVAAASRPLRVEQLAEFLAFDFDTNSTPTLREDWREEDPAHAVRSTCSSLLAIVDVDGSSVIQFAHFSVKEYLTSKRLAESKDTISRFHVSMTLAHTIVVQACLGVLLHIDERITKDDLKRFPLAKYAAIHWVGHAWFQDVSQNIQDEMRRLFDPNNHHLSVWVSIYNPEPGIGDSVSEGHSSEDPSSEDSTSEDSTSEDSTSEDTSSEDSSFECPPQAMATPLHYAAYWGLHEIAQFLIVERSQDVDALGFGLNETPLGVASRRGYPEVARVLLEHGADTDTIDIYGESPLDWASLGGHLEGVRVLLEHDAGVDSLLVGGPTALHTASSFGQVAVARFLLENGLDANTKDANDETPLHVATNDGIAQVLLEYGADPNARDGTNETPLHGVMWLESSGAARVLLENGVDVNARDVRNRTPLHVASLSGCLDCVRVLLQHSADIHARDDKGQTPFQAASERAASSPRRKYQEVMQLLLEHGAEDHRTE